MCTVHLTHFKSILRAQLVYLHLYQGLLCKQDFGAKWNFIFRPDNQAPEHPPSPCDNGTNAHVCPAKWHPAGWTSKLQLRDVFCRQTGTQTTLSLLLTACQRSTTIPLEKSLSIALLQQRHKRSPKASFQGPILFSLRDRRCMAVCEDGCTALTMPYAIL